MSIPARLIVTALLAVACSSDEKPAYEGEESADAGNCADGADNDYDGLFDCDDDGCADAVECGGSGSGSGSGDDGGSGSGDDGGSGDSSGSGDGGSGSDDGSDDPPPPVAVIGDVPLKCADESVPIDGSDSYSPSDDHWVTGWEWSWGPTDTTTSSFDMSWDTDEGATSELTLAVTDNIGQRSATTSTVVTTNTWPRLDGFRASGDCYIYDQSSDNDYVVVYWDDSCNTYSCSCQLQVLTRDPDNNQTYVWDADEPGVGPTMSASGDTLAFTFPSDFNHSYDYYSYCEYYTRGDSVVVGDPCTNGEGTGAGHAKDVTVLFACRYGTY